MADDLAPPAVSVEWPEEARLTSSPKHLSNTCLALVHNLSNTCPTPSTAWIMHRIPKRGVPRNLHS